LGFGSCSQGSQHERNPASASIISEVPTTITAEEARHTRQGEINLTIGTITEVSASTDVSSDQRLASLTNTRVPGKRRNLTELEKREVARLDSETATPLPEIRLRIGIAESSLYRLLQQRGVAARGRIRRADATAALVEAPSTGSGRAKQLVVDKAASPGNRRPPRAPGMRSNLTVSRRKISAVRRATASRATRASRTEYRVSFAAVQVVEAKDIHDAIRQAQNFGATEILRIERAD
jgi:pyruvate/2-oxoglutarate dehydrogenase complex dihydrolipoamide acyltransferase (E2) component